MNTAQVIAAATAFVSLLAAIIAGAWLNQRGIERQMDAFRNEMRAEFVALRAEIQTVGARVVSVESRVERIERQLEAIFKPVLPKA